MAKWEILFTSLSLVVTIFVYTPVAAQLQFCYQRPANCDTFCPYGYQRSQSNVCQCACFDPCQGKACSANEVCIVERLENVFLGNCRGAIDQCRYGVRVNTCLLSPCVLSNCSSEKGLICIADYCGRCLAHYFNRTTGEDVTLSCRLRYSYRFETTVKPGVCPKLTSGLCLNECRTDSDCDGTKKCCSNGCGQRCVSAEIQKPGECPANVNNITPNSCVTQCQSDVDCGGQEKCCWTGCSSSCVAPKQTLNAEAVDSQCNRLQSAMASLPERSTSSGYAPICESNGDFRHVQCDHVFCWCVNKLGQEVFGTKTLSGVNPDCDNPRPCPTVTCDGSCPFGLQTDENGCPLSSCKCVDYCEGVRCRRSFEICLTIEELCADQQSCLPKPQCLPNPCPEAQPWYNLKTRLSQLCDESGGCDANHWCRQVGFNDGGLCCPAPAAAIRPGQCPIVDTTTAFCVANCVVDADCPSYSKCCFNGCGLSCSNVSGLIAPTTVPPTVPPTVPIVSNRDADSQCPVVPPGLDTGPCENSCIDDENCAIGEKCCQVGCSIRCVPIAGAGIADQPPSAILSINEFTQPATAKLGECPDPDLGPNGLACSARCQSDADCLGIKKCCPTVGCYNQCVHPYRAPLCLQLTSSMQALVVGNPHISVPQCRTDGTFEPVQCSQTERICWCVNPETGLEVPGTRTQASRPDCQRPRACPSVVCEVRCLNGYKLDENGCPLCGCFDPCENVRCSKSSEVCTLMQAECNPTAPNCRSVPRCLINVCPSGAPARSVQSGRWFECESSSPCPEGFWCHNVGISGKGVCCQFPVRQMHAGHCPSKDPVPVGSGGACFVECVADDNCLEDQKCCFNGCGLSCVSANRYDPVLTTIPALSFTGETFPAPPKFSETSTESPRHTGVQATATQPALSGFVQKIGSCPNYISINRPDCASDIAECSSDSDCSGVRKCCNDGCVKRCLYAEVTTACLHVRGAYERLGAKNVPGSFVPQCKDNGEFEQIQCDSNNGLCWCVDDDGRETAGTRAHSVQSPPDCRQARPCPDIQCSLTCPSGYEMNDVGCPTCRCFNPCQKITCPESSELCVLTSANCSGSACVVPRCIPNACPQGSPMLKATLDISICRTSDDCSKDQTSFCRIFKADGGYCCPGTEAPARPGNCPRIQLTTLGSCRSDCHQDSDCSVNKKCCFNGCGLSCLSAVDSSSQDERCPSSLATGLSSCVVDCQSDADCAAGNKCCSYGCVRTCVLSVRPTQTPAPVRDVPKIGTCPAVSNGTTCSIKPNHECENDRDCEGIRKCCSDGCSKRCIYAKATTSCLHQRAAAEVLLRRQASLNDTMHVPLCRNDGQFETVQCDRRRGYCWCYDGEGAEITGTRTPISVGLPPCRQPRECPSQLCSLRCPYGFRLNDNGCETCDCFDPCSNVVCPTGEVCRLYQVDCVSGSCLPIPQCIPNPCPVGEPLKNAVTLELQQCGNLASESCPSSFWCHNVGYETNKGMCCLRASGSFTRNPSQTCIATAATDATNLQNVSCSHLCKTADDCPINEQCCFNGCALICTASSVNSSDSIDRPPKAGQCPSNHRVFPCGSRCTSDDQCPRAEKCCTTIDCDRQCIPVVAKTDTVCHQLRAALEKFATTRTGGPTIPTCATNGDFQRVQCHPDKGRCWCVDTSTGQEIPGTRQAVGRGLPYCAIPQSCVIKCNISCQHGLLLDTDGCPEHGRCQCRNLCKELKCSDPNQICAMTTGNCSESNCLSLPRCENNPCQSSAPIIDSVTGEHQACSISSNQNQCKTDSVCKPFSGSSFGLCCSKEATGGINLSVPASEGLFRQDLNCPYNIEYDRKLVECHANAICSDGLDCFRKSNSVDGVCCEPAASVCKLPANTGTCKSNTTRWHFDISTNACQPFNYGGCGGNFNNFETIDACRNFCVPHASSASVTDSSDSGVPTPPTFPLRKITVRFEGTNINEVHSEELVRLLFDRLNVADAIAPDLVDFQMLNNRVASFVAPSDIALADRIVDLLSRNVTLVLNGSVYSAKLETSDVLFPPSFTDNTVLLEASQTELPFTASSSFWGLIISSATFLSILLVIMITTYCVFRRRQRLAKKSRMITGAVPYTSTSYPAAGDETSRSLGRNMHTKRKRFAETNALTSGTWQSGTSENVSTVTLFY